MRCCGDKRLITVNQNKEKFYEGNRAVVRLGFLAGIVSLLSFPAIAQEVKLKKKQVPRAVISAFESAYPQATIRGFARGKENGMAYYEVESPWSLTRAASH